MKLNKNLKLTNLVLRSLNSPYKEGGGVFFADNKNILFVYYRLTGYNIPKEIIKELKVAGLIQIEKQSGLLKDKYIITKKGKASMSKPNYSDKDKKWWREKLLDIGNNFNKGYIGVSINNLWEIGYTDSVKVPSKILQRLVDKGKLIKTNHFYLTPKSIKTMEQNTNLGLSEGAFYPHMIGVRKPMSINPEEPKSTLTENLEVIGTVKRKNKPIVNLLRKKKNPPKLMKKKSKTPKLIKRRKK